MRGRQELSPAGTPSLPLRQARFEDVPLVLQLIEGAIDHGCREHYDREQRRAVYLAYATNLFVDSIRPFLTLVAEVDGRLAAFAQLDVADNVVRALFVDPAIQGRGLGRALLAGVEARARAAGCARICGAMSLNAVPFYERAGFLPADGPARLYGGGVRVPVVWMEKPLQP